MRANFFYLSEGKIFVPILPRKHGGSPICGIEFTIEKVYAKLSSLSSCKSSGHDGCHSRVFMETAEQLTLAAPLVIPYQKSFESQSFPKNWRAAYIIPIYKGEAIIIHLTIGQ